MNIGHPRRKFHLPTIHFLGAKMWVSGSRVSTKRSGETAKNLRRESTHWATAPEDWVMSAKAPRITIWIFPKIVGFPPKSSILIGFSIINHPFWGTHIFGNTHLVVEFQPHQQSMRTRQIGSWNPKDPVWTIKQYLSCHHLDQVFSGFFAQVVGM